MIELCGEALAEARGDDVRSARILPFVADAPASHRGGGRRGAVRRASGVPERPSGAATRPARAGDRATSGSAEAWAAETTPGLLERGVEIEEAPRAAARRTSTEPEYSLARQLVRIGDTTGPAPSSRSSSEGGGTRRRGDPRHVPLVAERPRVARRPLAAGRSTHADARIRAAGADPVRTCSASGWDEPRRSSRRISVSSTRRARPPRRRSRLAGDVERALRARRVGVLGRLELELGNLESGRRAISASCPSGSWRAGVQRPDADRLGGCDRDARSPLGELRACACLPRDRTRPTRERLGAAHGQRRAPPAVVVSWPAPRAICPGRFASFERSLAELETYPFPLERGRTLLCLGVVRRQAQQKRAAREALEAGARDLRGAGRAAMGGEGPGGAAADQRPRAGVRRADRDRAAGGRARRGGPHEQGDRGRAVHGGQHGRGAPLPRLSQARHPFTRQARRPAWTEAASR